MGIEAASVAAGAIARAWLRRRCGARYFGAVPEGDTIHKLAALLRDELEGVVLTQARCEGTALTEMVGQVVGDVFAHGKHLFVVGGGLVVRTHLGITGDWHRYAAGAAWQRPRWQASVLLATSAREYVCFRPMEVEVMRLRGMRLRALLRKLGPDLIDAEFAPHDAVSRARARHGGDAPLCDVLLDQQVAAGIGNVYKNELLFDARRHPLTPLCALHDAELLALFTRAAQWLRDNLGPGLRQTRAPTLADAATPDPDSAAHLWVYGRGGEPCLRCGGVVGYARLGRRPRGTYWCAGCQGGGAP